jgi:SSS family solute:Na+ symporter
MIHAHAPELLAGFLAAGVCAAIMFSLDSQTLSLGTMFTQDIVRHYGFDDKMTERQQVLAGRLFVVGILLATYLISLVHDRSIFRLGVWSFTGFAGLFPVVLAALFWKGSTKHGVLASIASVAGLWGWFFVKSSSVPAYSIGGTGVIPAALILVVSAAVLVLVSLMTQPPRQQVLERFFDERETVR